VNAEAKAAGIVGFELTPEMLREAQTDDDRPAASVLLDLAES
jgi:hypothetical protein